MIKKHNNVKKTPKNTVVNAKLFVIKVIAFSPKKYDKVATIPNLIPLPKTDPAINTNIGTPVAPEEIAINL